MAKDFKNKSISCRDNQYAKPPFRLEAHKWKKLDNRINWRMLMTKKTYKPGVLQTGWFNLHESMPYDHCTEGDSLASHYNRLGQEKCHCYATITSDQLRQCKMEKMKKRPDNRVINYLSFESLATPQIPRAVLFPDICVCDYLSETNKSFPPPYPYLMERISTPKVPYMSTQRIKTEDPSRSASRFYDEDHLPITKMMQCYKGHRDNSYNFCTGMYRDGSLPAERKQHCVKLDYE